MLELASCKALYYKFININNMHKKLKQCLWKSLSKSWTLQISSCNCNDAVGMATYHVACVGMIEHFDHFISERQEIWTKFSLIF